MTKMYCMLALLAICSTANAQIKKNDFLLGAHFSLSNATNNFNTPADRTDKNQSVGLSFGKAVKENTVVGLSFGYSHNSIEDENPNTYHSKANSYNAGVFLRKYKAIGTKLYFFGHADAGGYWSKQETFTPNNNVLNSTKTSGVSLGLTPGISYQVLKRLQMELLLGQLVGINYGSSKYTRSDDPIFVAKSSGFNFTTSLGGTLLQNLGIGFKLIL